jgi:serine/threonine-protein kinase
MTHGERLGRYELLELIGRGGMGEVYRARDSRLDRLVAIKTLPERLAADPGARSRFEREARAVAALSHPNILAIHDVGEAGGVLFVVTELLEGSTLQGRLRAGTLAPHTIRDYALQLARGLSAAHARGILHRDLKPANAFVTTDEHVKILDFGLALITAPAGQEHETRADVRTVAGAFLGTPAYMAPEQMRQQDVDHRSDLFALGAVLYEMVAGTPPFDGASMADVVTAVLTRDPRPLRPSDVLASRLERIAMRCLAKDASQRFQSADEVIGALMDSDTSRPIGFPSPAEPAAESRPSVAVLPFADLSPEQNLGYLCDGIAEEIIGGLARIDRLRVASRTSAFQFRGRGGDVRRMGEALGVAAVLEGSVRAAGTRLRVATQLVNAADGYQLWSERYDREAGDVFAVEDEIATAVVSALRGRFGAPAVRVVARGTADAEAHTLYLKGRHHWNKRTEEHLRTAAALFQAALDRDPVYGSAYAALADVFVTLGVYGAAAAADVMPPARAAAQRALSLAPATPGIHATLGTIAAVYDWDWPLANRLFDSAVQDDPEHAPTHHWRAMNCLVPQGRFEEGDRALARALALDPLSMIVIVSLGVCAFMARRYDEAVRQFESALALDDRFAMAHFFLGQVWTELGRGDDAVRELEAAAALSGDSAETHAALGHARARAGDHAAARRTLQDFVDRQRARYVSPVLIALVHVGLGEQDAALDALARAESIRAADLIWIGVRPAFDPLRQDPRFVALCTRIGVAGAIAHG